MRAQDLLKRHGFGATMHMLNPSKFPSPPHSERRRLHLKKKTIMNTLIIMAVTKTRRRKLQNKMRKKSLIKTYGTFLEGLTHLPNKCRKKMIEVIDCVGECCINLIKGNVPLTNAQKNQLRARKQHIRLVSSKQVPLDTKREIINQKGGPC